MPAHPDKEASAGEDTFLLVPLELRQRLDSLTLEFVFDLKEIDLPRALGDLARNGSKPDWRMSLSSAADPAVGLVIFPCKQPRRFHCVVEFRRGRRSPYVKVTPKRAMRWVELLNQGSDGLYLRRWSETTSSSTTDFSQKHTELAQMMSVWRIGSAESKNQARISGIEVAIDSSEDPSVKAGFVLRWDENRVRLIKRLELDRRFETLRSAFEARESLLTHFPSFAKEAANVG